MGVKISNLPPIVTPALTDIFPVVQAGVTYKETVTQLSTLLGTVAVTTITGTANQVIASSPTGAVTLSLPQSIATTSNVTFGSVTFSPTTKGIVGTPTNNNAAATFVGEYISSSILSGSKVTLTTATPTNITSIALTAGDWDLSWSLLFETEATTSVSVIRGGASASSAAVAASTETYSQFAMQWSAFVPNITTFMQNGARSRVSLGAPATVYLCAQSTFTIANMFSYGWISARRVR